MPKRKKGGYNNTRRKVTKNTELKYRDPEIGQKYARVKKPRGSCTFTVETIDGVLVHSSLAGRLRKKNCRISENDLVLIEPLTEHDDGNHIIIFKYSKGQEKILSNEGHLAIVVEEAKEKPNEDIAWEFEGDEKDNVAPVVELDENMIDDI